MRRPIKPERGTPAESTRRDHSGRCHNSAGLDAALTPVSPRRSALIARSASCEASSSRSASITAAWTASSHSSTATSSERGPSHRRRGRRGLRQHLTRLEPHRRMAAGARSAAFFPLHTVGDPRSRALGARVRSWSSTRLARAKVRRPRWWASARMSVICSSRFSSAASSPNMAGIEAPSRRDSTVSNPVACTYRCLPSGLSSRAAWRIDQQHRGDLHRVQCPVPS